MGVFFYDNEIWNETSEIKIVGGQEREGRLLTSKTDGKKKKTEKGTRRRNRALICVAVYWGVKRVD